MTLGRLACLATHRPMPSISVYIILSISTMYLLCCVYTFIV